ncbi:hypothetical protein BDP27DRAFT_1428036 [Rhodocollybia butyracea]|uniref:Uncharacterized protein n=1 Tax=Rhodocollybia butyracea TaxID=206335 RepID=A0A9P5PHS3_9AGAR|nr:hypothetical protein BDP27DRAFT_1428036 [Rhodocollybia butyracea]
MTPDLTLKTTTMELHSFVMQICCPSMTPGLTLTLTMTTMELHFYNDGAPLLWTCDRGHIIPYYLDMHTFEAAPVSAPVSSLTSARTDTLTTNVPDPALATVAEDLGYTLPAPLHDAVDLHPAPLALVGLPLPLVVDAPSIDPMSITYMMGLFSRMIARRATASPFKTFTLKVLAAVNSLADFDGASLG